MLKNTIQNLNTGSTTHQILFILGKHQKNILVRMEMDLNSTKIMGNTKSVLKAI